MSFFSELKRRNVFRVALLYMVASWLVMQVADVGISLLGLPLWSGRFVFLLLAIGFPLVMVFSWVYEITPEGLKRETEVDRTASVTHQTARKLDLAVIVLLILGLGALALDRLLPEAAAPAEQVAAASAAVERSIAVMPFVNMSSDRDNDFFSDGLSEELLNLLAKIPDLKVAARTSTFRFKDSGLGIAEIAAQLNVAHVLEGSVRKSGNDIRITAQLINVADGYHLWSETWDRKLVDVFAIQDEIAAAVVKQLRVTLLGEMPTVPVTDPDAYALYLQATQVAQRYDEDSLEEALSLLTQALAIDPGYAEGWTELSRAHTNLVGQGFVSPDEGYARAEAAAERALAIDPSHARAMSNLGWLAMYWEWDFAKAARLIGEARRLEPGNPPILNAWGVLLAAFGRIEAAAPIYEEGLTVDPFSTGLLFNLAGAYLNIDRLDDAERLIARLAELEPDSPAMHFMSGWLENRRGNAESALAHFARAEGLFASTGTAISLYDIGRDEQSDATLDDIRAQDRSELYVAIVHAYREEKDEAFDWLERAYEARDASMIELRMYRFLLKPLMDDPRWDDLIARIGPTDEMAARLGIN